MESKPDKIIFLDIDHVLTNIDLDGTSFMYFDPEKYRLSEINLKLLDRLLAESGAKIVIASNWRKFSPEMPYWIYGGKRYYSPLNAFKERYSKHIAGSLPPDRHINKSQALSLWFEDNSWFSKTAGKYVILEDDPDEEYQADVIYAKHLVMTDPKFGLTEDDLAKALRILGHA